MQALHLVEVDFAIAAARETAHHAIARTDAGIERGERLLRLDHEPLPAPQVEPEGDVVGDRVAAADIDVRSWPIGKDQIEVVVLEVLCI